MSYVKYLTKNFIHRQSVNSRNFVCLFHYIYSHVNLKNNELFQANLYWSLKYGFSKTHVVRIIL